jgi:hypothetical protein
MPAVYLPQVEDDVAAAHAGYERLQAGLGDRFLAAVRDQVDGIRSNPQLYGAFRRDSYRPDPLRQSPCQLTMY